MVPVRVQAEMRSERSDGPANHALRRAGSITSGFIWDSAPCGRSAPRVDACVPARSIVKNVLPPQGLKPVNASISVISVRSCEKPLSMNLEFEPQHRNIPLNSLIINPFRCCTSRIPKCNNWPIRMWTIVALFSSRLGLFAVHPSPMSFVSPVHCLVAPKRSSDGGSVQTWSIPWAYPFAPDRVICFTFSKCNTATFL
jgi:hypothetical protein